MTKNDIVRKQCREVTTELPKHVHYLLYCCNFNIMLECGCSNRESIAWAMLFQADCFIDVYTSPPNQLPKPHPPSEYSHRQGLPSMINSVWLSARTTDSYRTWSTLFVGPWAVPYEVRLGSRSWTAIKPAKYSSISRCLPSQERLLKYSLSRSVCRWWINAHLRVTV